MAALFLPVHLCLILMTVVFGQTEGAKFIFGGEAQRVCDAYKMLCPARKVCVLQSIEWPRAMKFPVCVFEKDVSVKSTICRRAPKVGTCGARFVRWYFNVHMGSCSWFTYSGCGGNKNNFRTAEECEKRCMVNGVSEADEGVEGTRRPEASSNDVLETGMSENDDDRRREPKFIPAPAKAAEMLDLDSELAASLQIDEEGKKILRKALRREQRNKNREKRKQEERARRRAERERRRKLRQERKKRRQNRKTNLTNQTTYISVPRDRTVNTPPKKAPHPGLSPIELGPGYYSRQSTSSNPNYAEMSEGRTSKIDLTHLQQDQQQWLIDDRFGARRRRRRRNRAQRQRRIRTNNYNIPGVEGDLTPPVIGAKQDTYYDRVNLFKILYKDKQGRKGAT